MAFGSLPSVLGSGGGTAYSLIGGTGLFANGTAAAPSISFASQSGLGVYRVASGILGFVSGGGGLTLNLTTGTPTFSAFNYAASIAIQDAVNGNIALTPSGTGQVLITGNRLQLSANSGVLAPIQFVDTNASGRTWQLGPGLATGAVTEFSLYDVTGGGSVPLVTFMTGGKLRLNTATDSGALLQIGTNTTTSAGGMVFGTDTQFFRSAAGFAQLNGVGIESKLQIAGNSTVRLSLGTSGFDGIIAATSGILYFQTNGTTTALTLDASQRTILSGALRLNHAYTAGVGAATGYLTVQDSTGTTYKIPVLA